MDFSNLKSWMPAAGFDNGTFYRDVHYKQGEIEYGRRCNTQWDEDTEDYKINGEIDGISRPICKADGKVVGVVFIREFHDPSAEFFDDRTDETFRFCAVVYAYAIPKKEWGYIREETGTYLAFFGNKEDAWVAVCDAAAEMEKEVRDDMCVGRANRYFTTEHLNATYYPFSGRDKNPDDNGGFYDPATPLFNEQVLPATTS